MSAPDPPRNASAEHIDPEPDTPSRRRRQLIESAAVVGELTAALIADSRHLIARSNDLIARPHMIVTTVPNTAPRTRPAVVCERCGLGIETPGVAIVRGRNVMHVGCA
jgi:hypothetical protein